MGVCLTLLKLSQCLAPQFEHPLVITGVLIQEPKTAIGISESLLVGNRHLRRTGRIRYCERLDFTPERHHQIIIRLVILPGT